MTFSNRVILTGKVVIPPRRHYRPDGSAVIQFPLELNDPEDSPGQALNRTASRKRGRKRIDIVAFGELAEFHHDLLQSGQHLMVIGSLNQRCWQTPEGRNRTCTEVIATSLQTIEEKSRSQTSTPQLTDPKVDGCTELTLNNGKSFPQRRDLPPVNGSKKQGE
jgi:single stranded DNA-binding protein